MRLPISSVLAIIAFLALTLASRVEGQSDFLLLRFEQYLEALTEQAGIPGLSAAIVEDQEIVWEHGFGFQDVEARIPATPDTPYQVAGMTQVFTAEMVLACVDAGRVHLDDPIGDYTTEISDATATVQHVLTHTSDDTPGTDFDYDLERYVALGAVIEECGGSVYRVRLARFILNRLGMSDSVPGEDVVKAGAVPSGAFDRRTINRYRNVLDHLARPYRVDRNGRASESHYPNDSIDASTGLISTVRDLARFDAALDLDLLVDSPTIDLAWTNPHTPSGRRLPHGMGWFVQTYHGQRVVWQFGMYQNASSSLILKLPDRHRTLILLANSDGLSAPFRLSSGDVTESLFAQLFLRLFA